MMESEPLHIHFENVDTFKNKVTLFLYLCCLLHMSFFNENAFSQVVYADVKNEDNCLHRLQNIVALLKDRCKSDGIPIADEGFTPHLTLVKLSKDPGLWRKVIKKR